MNADAAPPIVEVPAPNGFGLLAAPKELAPPKGLDIPADGAPWLELSPEPKTLLWPIPEPNAVDPKAGAAGFGWGVEEPKAGDARPAPNVGAGAVPEALPAPKAEAAVAVPKAGMLVLVPLPNIEFEAAWGWPNGATEAAPPEFDPNAGTWEEAAGVDPKTNGWLTPVMGC